MTDLSDDPRPAPDDLVPPPRKFPDHFFSLMEHFAQQALQLPEIAGLAIIPVYADGKAEKMIPGGYHSGKAGPLRTPNELLEMAVQFSYAQRRVLDSIGQLTKHIDGQMSQMATESRRLLAEIEERRAVLRNQGTK